MSKVTIGADGKARCAWCDSAPEFNAYHDTEWGFPVTDDIRLFEKICLEGFQSGLSWRTILAKRENFRAAFAGFDFHKVAQFGEADVERLLSAASVTVDLESPASDDAQYCLGQYFEELSRRFEGGFDPARSLPIDEAEIKPPHGAFLVMRLQGRPVGCGAFKRLDQDAAYLKRMWIADEARGLGLGRRLLKELEDRAGSYGYRTAKLETNKSLTQAIRLYHRSGYREVPPFNDEPFAHHWFEKPLG